MKVTFIALLVALQVPAATYYIDSVASGVLNGTSWANAWTNFNGITGLSAGDTVYFSGGSSGQTKTYFSDMGTGYPGIWLPTSGSAGSPITYAVSQESAHNGTVMILNFGTNYWLGYQTTPRPHDIVIDGVVNGQPHFVVTNCNSVGALYSYTNFVCRGVWQTGGAATFDLQACWNVDISSNRFHINSDVSDHSIVASFPQGLGYGSNVFHHNTLYLPNSPPNGSGGNGPDGFQISGSGFDIYNNTVIGFWQPTFTGNQHQDGWQALGPGKNIRVFNNTWVNIANYPMFPEPFAGGFTNLLMYNNLIMLQGTNFAAGDTLQGLVMAGTTAYVANNCHVFNNTVLDFTNSYAIAFRDPGSGNNPNAFVNCSAVNNLFVNCKSQIIDPNVSTNKNFTLSTGTDDLLTYSVLGGTNNNPELKAGSALIGAGTNYNAFAATDILGTTRGATWDIGAYEYTPIYTVGTLTISGQTTVESITITP